MELKDVQALWGGRRILVEWPRRVVVRVVERGSRRERRYEWAPADGGVRQLWDLLIRQDFLTIHPADRPGIPDEARPQLALTNAIGERWEVSKWAGVKDDRFDKIYRAMLGLEGLTTELKPVYVGPMEVGT